MDATSSLKRRERVIAMVRWLAIAFALLQNQLYVPPVPALQAAADTARGQALVLVGVLALVGLVVEVVLRTVDDPRFLVRFGAVVLAADIAVALGFAWAYAFDPVSAQWTMLTVLPLEGALRFQLRGALGVWAVVVPTYLLRDVYAARVHEVTSSAGAVSYRLGLLLVIALFAGFMARDLEKQRAGLARLSGAQKELASRLEPAEILQALCRQAVGCLGSGSAVVYAYDGVWLYAVASWPADTLPAVLDQDQEEEEDHTLLAELAAGPLWLESSGPRPRRLAVPLRWRDDPVRHVLVYRPDGGTVSAFDVDVAASLGEAAALAMATTRVLATEQRTNRRLQHLEALRTRFVATVAHDLRRPLTVFKGAAQLLRRDIEPDQVTAMLDSVERQANRLNRLADDLVDAARMDADRLVLHTGPCDLAAIVAAAVADTDEEVVLDMPASLPLQADAARLERVVWNLVSNAEKYGKPPFEITACADGEGVRLAVRDHGSGLDAEQQNQLFTEFAGSDDPSSIGLGLSIVHQLVHAHGGTVRYADAAPGASFTVWLPPAPAHDGPG